MTLGMMMSLTYIIGQLSAPVEQFISFVQGFQDAQISIARLNEIHNREDEINTQGEKRYCSELSPDRSIYLKGVSFNYEGVDRDYILSDISLCIPDGKVTAIVGASGSGKTTILKLLMGFYPPVQGEIRIGNTSMNIMNAPWWRSRIGAVMQDGYIFSDSIARNIALNQDIDFNRL